MNYIKSLLYYQGSIYSQLRKTCEGMINYNSPTRLKMDAYYKVKRVDCSKLAQRTDHVTSGYGDALQGYGLSVLGSALGIAARRV
mgnify:CR=1 FL=1